MRWRRELPGMLKSKVVPAGSVRRRYWWNRLFIQVAPPYFYKGLTRQEIFEQLGPAAARSSELLAEAQQIVDDENDRREHVERRATGLQGAVAIAFGFALAGGGLLLDANKLPSSAWRTLVAAAYLLTVLCLVATAIRALRATVRVHAYHYPHPEGPVQRAPLGDNVAARRRAAELLHAYSRNQPIVDYQVTQMRASGHWFAGAVLGLVITAVLVVGARLDTDHHASRERVKREVPRTALFDETQFEIVRAELSRMEELLRRVADAERRSGSRRAPGER
jgi:hypothetical protein